MPDDFFYITSSKIEKWNPHPPITIGQVLNTGEVNPFFNFFLDAHIPTEQVTNNGVVEQWSWMRFLSAIRFGGMNTSLSQQAIAARGHYLAMHFCKYTRELIWESVRAENYPDKPSRQKCLWLSQGEKNMNYWKPKVGEGSTTQQVYRVEIEGTTHEASDEHLMNDNLPYQKALEMSHRYWKGDISNHEAREILFKGSMRIVERVS